MAGQHDANRTGVRVGIDDGPQDSARVQVTVDRFQMPPGRRGVALVPNALWGLEPVEMYGGATPVSAGSPSSFHITWRIQPVARPLTFVHGVRVMPKDFS